MHSCLILKLILIITIIRFTTHVSFLTCFIVCSATIIIIVVILFLFLLVLWCTSYCCSGSDWLRDKESTYSLGSASISIKCA